ncbi:hypothetical protein HMPREF1207_05461 [Paenibacillus sp. HGH0039]|nr:hypothetical protein HMPREF1207_05461 [Paenibacillus sp. HGH0039]
MSINWKLDSSTTHVSSGDISPTCANVTAQMHRMSPISQHVCDQ